MLLKLLAGIAVFLGIFRARRAPSDLVQALAERRRLRARERVCKVDQYAGRDSW